MIDAEDIKHSELPWRTSRENGQIEIFGAGGGFCPIVGCVDYRTFSKDEDAEFTVHCVNNHYKLVEALQLARINLPAKQSASLDMLKIIDKVESALKAATGKE